MRIKAALVAIICSIISSMSVMAQDKQLTLHDLIPGGKNYSRFTPRNLKQLGWCGDEYIYVKGDSVWGARPGKREAVLFSRERLNAETSASSPASSMFVSMPQPQKTFPSLSREIET